MDNKGEMGSHDAIVNKEQEPARVDGGRAASNTGHIPTATKTIALDFAEVREARDGARMQACSKSCVVHAARRRAALTVDGQVVAWSHYTQSHGTYLLVMENTGSEQPYYTGVVHGMARWPRRVGGK